MALEAVLGVPQVESHLSAPHTSVAEDQAPWRQASGHSVTASPVRWNEPGALPSSTAQSTSRPPNMPSGPAGPDVEVKKPPRPPNAWILYRSDCIRKQRESRSPGAPKPTQAELSKLFGEQWRNEAEEVKAEYERQAEAARDEHTAKYPDWRFSRKPMKLGRVGSSDDTLSSPKVPARNLQVPSHSETAKKRRRNTSGASSDPPTPPETSTELTPSPGYAYQGTSLPPLATLSEQFDKSLYPFPSVLAAPPSPYSFPYVPASASPTLNPGSQHSGTYRPFSQQDGLESTLAQRNTSAAQFYNIYDFPHRPNGANSGRPSTSHAERAPPASHATSIGFSAPASAPGDANRPAYYVNGNSLPFDQSHISLPNMPFGMASNEFAFGAQSANEGPRWMHSHVSAQPGSGQGAVPIDPALTHTVGFEYPEWLFALRDIRVRQDDFAGIPLLDFLNDVRLRAGQPQIDSTREASSTAPYSFP